MESPDNLRALEQRIEQLEFEITNPKILTPREVCDFLRISEAQLYAWKREGNAPPAIYFSQRTVRYDRDAVLTWAKQMEIGAAALNEQKGAGA